MLSLQVEIRALVNADFDCSESSVRLMAMRAEMVDLIRRRNAMGDIEASLNIAERPKPRHRPELRRRIASVKEKTGEKPQEKPGRSRALSI